MRIRRLLFCGLLAAATACHASPVRSPVARGTGLGLAVIVSVDQLRGDIPGKFFERFGEGGFRRLYRDGVFYPQAHYAHSATETAVGHATLATGALPRDHGIVGNEWSEQGDRVYSVDDRTEPLLGAAGPGMSPFRLLAETLGEVLERERPGALARSVALKERAAILMAGRAGNAYWLDDSAGSFVTSRFYAERLPSWVEEFAKQRPAEHYRTLGWPLLAPESSYTAPDDRPWERGGGELGGVLFPHAFTAGSDDRFVHALRSTPFGDELTLAFVRAMFENEPLGRDDVPDLLLVSFSSTDYVGHTFGPESREAEDNLLRLDRTLAGLLQLLDEQVGEGRYFVALSSDHGVAETPEWFLERGLDAGRVDPELLESRVDEGLRERFGLGVELVSEFVNPSLVLREQRIASLSLDLAEIERAAAELAATVPGVHAAFTRSDLVARTLPDSPFKARLEQSTHPERSGHVYIVPKENWLLATHPEPLAAMHGTPWPYDTHVPLVLYGTRARSQSVARAVDPRDLAPTFARLLGISAPRAATGELLIEALPARPSQASAGGAATRP